MQTRLKLFASACLLLVMNGCATRSAVILDSSSDWMMVDAPSKVSVSTVTIVNGEEVWVHAGKVVIPAGMMIGPGPRK